MRRSLLLLLFAAFVAINFPSCENDPGEIGLGIQPSSDQLSIGFDTSLYVQVYSEIEDSIRTDRTSLNVLGSMYDPVFGKSTAGFYTQFRLSSSGHDFGTNPVVDSLVLKLLYAGSYGDTLSPITIRVQELTGDLYADSLYYSVNRTAVDESIIGEYTLVPKPRDSVQVDTVYYAPQLWLNLSKNNPALAQKLIEASPEDMASNDDFLLFFKGLSISAAEEQNPGSGQIAYFSMEAATSALYMYYHNDEEDSLSFIYNVNSYCARYNTYEHYGYQHADPSLRNQILNNDTMSGDQIAYLQAMGGIRVRLQMPDLEPLKNIGNIALNEAKLVFDNAQSDEDLFFPPPTYLIYHLDKEDGSYDYISDQYEGTAYFGGNYNFETNEVWMRITTYMQSVMDGETFDGNNLYLAVSGASIKGNRIQLVGGKPDDPALFNKRIRLEVVYSKIQ